MNIQKLALPLSEHLRPSSLEELMLLKHEITSIQKMVCNGVISNMIFYGPPGTGKTSAARIIARGLDADVFNVDGASERGAKIILNDVPDFVRTASLFGKRKLVVIDEGEFMTRKDQVSLRTTIEDSCEYCHFIITTNDLKRIDKAIQSRLVGINFSVQLSYANEIVDRMVHRIGQKLDELQVHYEISELRRIVKMYFPDFRQTVNQIEFRFG